MELDKRVDFEEKSLLDGAYFPGVKKDAIGREESTKIVTDYAVFAKDAKANRMIMCSKPRSTSKVAVLDFDKAIANDQMPSIDPKTKVIRKRGTVYSYYGWIPCSDDGRPAHKDVNVADLQHKEKDPLLSLNIHEHRKPEVLIMDTQMIKHDKDTYLITEYAMFARHVKTDQMIVCTTPSADANAAREEFQQLQQRGDLRYVDANSQLLQSRFVAIKNYPWEDYTPMTLQDIPVDTHYDTLL